MGYVRWSLSCLLGILFEAVLADIYVQKFENQTTHPIAEFDDYPARNWGQPLGDVGIVGVFAGAEPADGCSTMKESPKTKNSCFALIRRGGCNFDAKALNAQRAGFSAAVIYNDRSDDIFAMAGGRLSKDVNIPAVFIGLTDGLTINSTYLFTIDDNVTIIIDGKIAGINWLDRYVWPFLGSILFVFFLLAAFTVYKWSLDRRRRRRNRLSARKLKKIPIKKFTKGDPYDVCAICLDEYEEQDELRILPCNHAYHVKCIDPWLTKAKRQCPVCKRKVSPGSDNSSRSSAPEQTEGSGSQVIVEQGAESEGTTTTTPEDVAVTTDEESEEEEAPETQVDGETTPLVLRSENEEVEIRSRSLFSRLRDALSSWDERRRRRSSLITPTPIDNRPATRSVGYGSLSEVPTEFHPTLPPPPARSFQPRASLDATARSPDSDQLSGGRGQSVRQQSDDSDDEGVRPAERHSATMHQTPHSNANPLV